MARFRGVALFALVAASGARADPTPHAQLVYLRPAGAAGCPDEKEVRAAVTARLGYDPFADGGALTVSVSIARDGRGLHAQIDLLDATTESGGSRQLSSKRRDCRDLAPAIELAISIAIDPMRARRPPTESGTRVASDGSAKRPLSGEQPSERRGAPVAKGNERPDPTVPPVPAPEPDAMMPTLTDDNAPPAGRAAADEPAVDQAPADQPPVDAPAADRPPVDKPPVDQPPPRAAKKLPPVEKLGPLPETRIWAGIGALAGFGSAPGPVLGFTVEAGLHRRRWALAVEVRGDLPASQTVAGSAGRIEVAQLVLSAIPCVRLTRFVTLDLCATATVGAQVAQGQGFAVVNDTSTTAVLDLGARVGLDLPLGRRFALSLHLDGKVALLTTALHADGVEAFRTSRLQGAIGAAFRFFFR